MEFLEKLSEILFGVWMTLAWWAYENMHLPAAKLIMFLTKIIGDLLERFLN